MGGAGRNQSLIKSTLFFPTLIGNASVDGTSDGEVTLQIRSIFSYFPTRKPCITDFEDGVNVVMTPEGPTWDAYDQNYTDNE